MRYKSASEVNTGKIDHGGLIPTNSSAVLTAFLPLKSDFLSWRFFLAVMVTVMVVVAVLFVCILPESL